MILKKKTGRNLDWTQPGISFRRSIYTRRMFDLYKGLMLLGLQDFEYYSYGKVLL